MIKLSILSLVNFLKSYILLSQSILVHCFRHRQKVHLWLKAFKYLCITKKTINDKCVTYICPMCYVSAILF